MIRPSDKGPGRPRPPRVKQPRTPTPPSSGEKTSWWPCSMVIAVPALSLIFACTALAEGVTR